MALPDPTDIGAEDLEDFLAGPLDIGTLSEDPQPAPDAIVASRLLRRRRRLNDNEAQVERQAAAELAGIAKWKAERLATIQRERAWVDRSLEGFMVHHYHETHEPTVSTPNGTLKYTKKSSTVEVVDEAAAIDWALKAGVDDAVKVEMTFLKSKVGKTSIIEGRVVTANGEIIPGIIGIVPDASDRRFGIQQ